MTQQPIETPIRDSRLNNLHTRSTNGNLYGSQTGVSVQFGDTSIYGSNGAIQRVSFAPQPVRYAGQSMRPT
jgi:hypothetical protein